MRGSSCLFIITILLRPSIAYIDEDAAPRPQPRSVPFNPPARSLPRIDGPLFRRQQQGNCQANYISCSYLSAPEACCPLGSSCARDGAGNIACCPNNNACTGTVGGSSGGSPTTTSSGPSMTITPGTTITSGPSSNGNGAGSVPTDGTVPNDYYPFPIVATIYPNAGSCSSAYAFCQQQSSQCYASLAGQNAVTVSNMFGGGITQGGGGGVLQASASSICSSLSLTACHGLQASQCAQLGNSGGNAGPSLGQGPRETGHPGARYVAAFGMVGVIGLAV